MALTIAQKEFEFDLSFMDNNQDALLVRKMKRLFKNNNFDSK